MNSIKVHCYVDTYPEDGQKKETIQVSSHWNQKQKVRIIIGTTEMNIVGRDLITAIENCMRCN